MSNVNEAPNNSAMSVAAKLFGVLGMLPYLRSRPTPKPRKPVPTMVCSPRAEIAAWNEAVEARKVRAPKQAKSHPLTRRQYKRARMQHLREAEAA